jgi:hypothetical protein
MPDGLGMEKMLQDEQNKLKMKKKAKAGGKLSHDEIRNLSTDELFSYIENQGKKLK